MIAGCGLCGTSAATCNGAGDSGCLRLCQAALPSGWRRRDLRLLLGNRSYCLHDLRWHLGNSKQAGDGCLLRCLDRRPSVVLPFPQGAMAQSTGGENFGPSAYPPERLLARAGLLAAYCLRARRTVALRLAVASPGPAILPSAGNRAGSPRKGSPWQWVEKLPEPRLGAGRRLLVEIGRIWRLRCLGNC